MNSDNLQLIDQINHLPDHPGIYFFCGEGGVILYIGKATSLRDRVKSYLDVKEPAKQRMVIEARTIEFQLFDTVLEAVIAELKAIKKHKPKYNILQKDDKSLAYLVFTDEEYPRLTIMRGREIERLGIDNAARDKIKIARSFGPFFASKTIEKILQILRPIIIFRSCKNPAQKRCLYGRIHQCPLHNDPPLSKVEYKRNLNAIAAIFNGKTKQLLTRLNSELKSATQIQDFERAAILRDQIFGLTHINDITLIEERTSQEDIPRRLEAYDISHFGGKDAVGAFIVLANGKIERSQYRKFIIRGKDTQDDPRMIEEVLLRRLAHKEWVYPDLIMLDGGITQLKAGARALAKLELTNIALVASAKGEDRKANHLLWYDPPQEQLFDQKELLKLIKLAQMEVHRFVISFQKTRRKIR